MRDAPNSPALGGPGRRHLRYKRGGEEFGRLLAFTDGVVAIALTLLVLTIDLPHPDDGDVTNASLVDALDDLGPQFFAFLLSFVIIGAYWLGHHRFVAQLKAIDLPLLVWSLVFLLAIALMPFEAEVIGNYAQAPLGVALYAGWFVLFGIVSLAGYLVAWKRDLLAYPPSPAMVRAQTIGRLPPPVIFALSIPLAYLASPSTAMWSWMAIWPLSYLVGRLFPTPEAERAQVAEAMDEPAVVEGAV